MAGVDEQAGTGVGGEGLFGIESLLQEAREAITRGALKDAYGICSRVLAQSPNHPRALLLIGELHAHQGDHSRALELYQQVLAATPNDADAYAAAGGSLFALGQRDDARDVYERALSLVPNHPNAHLGAGVMDKAARNFVDAVTHLTEAVAVAPERTDVRFHLATALIGADQPDDAFDQLAMIVQTLPDDLHVGVQQVVALSDADRLDEVSAIVDHLVSGRDASVVYYSLGAALIARNQSTYAADYFVRALAAPADNRDYVFWRNLDAPREYILHFGAGNAYLDLGMFPESREHFEAAAKVRPGMASVENNRLLGACYDPDVSPTMLRAMHAEWGAGVMARSARWAATSHANTADLERVLKVGYLSPDLCIHPVSIFLSSIVSYHEPSAVDVSFYANVKEPDALTDAMRNMAPHWVDVVGMSDRALADRIRADEIDILVDLAGLTASNRLRVLAYRPAPIQVSYLGYPATTGLDAVDYRITDAIANPPDSDAYYTEKLVRLDDGFCCFLPTPDAPEPNSLPALDNGHVTFGCALNFKKINRRALSLWAQVMAAVPDARLVIFRHSLSVPATRRHLEAMLRDAHMPMDRVDLRWQRPESGFMEVYHQFDVVLDTVPFCGHTSTCEALWMGVPVLTRTTEDFAGRMGASVLSMAGLPDWVAHSDAEYVEKAVSRAADTVGLAALRQDLRRRVEGSPLMDAHRFTRTLESAYREMWYRWCSQQGADGAAK